MSLPVAFCGSECYGGGGLSVGVDCGACYPCAFYTVVYEAVLEWCPCTSRQYEVGGDAVFGYFAQECQVGGVSGAEAARCYAEYVGGAECHLPHYCPHVEVGEH